MESLSWLVSISSWPGAKARGKCPTVLLLKGGLPRSLTVV